MMTTTTSTINFLLNGKPVSVKAKPTDLLIDYLRSGSVNLTGTKLSCGEGGCGACTVLWTRYDFDQEQLVEVPVNSCLRPLCSLDGTAITTVEGIAAPSQPDLVQTNMVNSCASQCGYCSPGFVMTMHGLLKKDPQPAPQAIEDQFAGNICRCTGFISILKAMHQTGADLRDQKPLADQPTPTADDFKPARPLVVDRGGYRYYRPQTIDEVLELLATNPVPAPFFKHIKLVQGNTSIGIYKKGVEDPRLLIDVTHLPYWHRIEPDGDGLLLAGGVTIEQLLDYLRSPALGDLATPALNALRLHVGLIAGVQVRSAASVAGSLMLPITHQREGTPFPGDLYTVLGLLGAEIHYRVPSEREPRVHAVLDFPAPDAFPLGFLITAVRIPAGSAAQLVKTYRVARRTQNSHPIVNAAFSCTLTDTNTVSDINLVYGGIANIAQAMPHTRQFVLDNPQLVWGPELLEAVLPVLEKELADTIKVAPDAIFPADYLLSLATRLFYKFFVAVCLDKNLPLAPGWASAADAPPRPLASGNQDYLDAPYYDGPGAVPAPLAEVAAGTFAMSAKVAPLATGALQVHQQKNFMMVQLEAPAAAGPLADVQVKPLPAVESQPLVVSPPSTPFEPKQSLIKIDAYAQVNGTAKYTHDLTHSADTLESCYVYSQHRHALFAYSEPLDSICQELAAQFDGACYIHADTIKAPIPGVDTYDANSPSAYDPIFASGRVTCFGMPIGLVVASTLEVARAGAEFINSKIVYDDFPADETFATLDEAIVANQTMLDSKTQHRIHFITRPLSATGSELAAKESWLSQPAPVEGRVFVSGGQATGAQVHFYMEPQGALAVPRENNQLEVYSSTQNQSSVQRRVAALLAQPMHNVRVGITRLGGGFGGKELRQVYVAAAAAVAAWVLQKPVRLLLDRNTDMRMVGTRHPFKGAYDLVATADGVIEKMFVKYASDGGISYDCSFPVMDLALLCAENAYYVDTFKTTGEVYRTNIQSRTAFRSFGLVQSMLITETALEHLAFQLKMRPDLLRQKNFYRDAQVGDPNPQRTPYGSPLPYCRINQVWHDFGQKIDFEERLQAVESFNQQNRWRKRGLSMIPLKYGVSYTYRPMNQGSAYVLAYKEDGSVLLHHGGVEMGQGMNTKMAQIAANELGLDIGMIRIATTSTAVIPNVSSTGASTGSDLNGQAVLMACRELKATLTGFLKDYLQHPKSYPDVQNVSEAQINLYLAYLDNPAGKDASNWLSIIKLAALARISISAQYSFASPKLGAVAPVGNPAQPSNYQITPADSQVFYYYNYCVAASEVEVDVLTGQFEILRSDIVYDAGDSLNDNIDYGQIEGGFIQGVGCLTTEEVLYGEQGRVLTDGTWEYKPPCSKTIPQQFNVYLLKYVATSDKTAPPKDGYGIKSSKSTGEPPLVLANSVFFAIRQAVHEARKEGGRDEWFEFTAPATVQKIQQACAVGSLTTELA